MRLKIKWLIQGYTSNKSDPTSTHTQVSLQAYSTVSRDYWNFVYCVFIFFPSGKLSPWWRQRGSINGSSFRISQVEQLHSPLPRFSWVLWAQLVKNLLAMSETWVRSLGWEDPLEKEKDTHSSILAWRIPWGHKESDTTEWFSLSLCGGVTW